MQQVSSSEVHVNHADSEPRRPLKQTTSALQVSGASAGMQPRTSWLAGPGGWRSGSVCIVRVLWPCKQQAICAAARSVLQWERGVCVFAGAVCCAYTCKYVGTSEVNVRWCTCMHAAASALAQIM